jgi:hypothetical protein
MRAGTIYVHGYLQLVQSFDRSVRELGPAFRGELKRVGDIVRMDAAARFAPYDKKSAAGYRTYVTQKHVNVGQSIRATTGTRPDYGALQMRKALLPALYSKQADIREGFEKVLDGIMIRNFLYGSL